MVDKEPHQQGYWHHARWHQAEEPNAGPVVEELAAWEPSATRTPGLPLLKTRSARSFNCYSPTRPKRRSHVSSELTAWSSKALLADGTGSTSPDQQTSTPQFATGPN